MASFGFGFGLVRDAPLQKSEIEEKFPDVFFSLLDAKSLGCDVEQGTIKTRPFVFPQLDQEPEPGFFQGTHENAFFFVNQPTPFEVPSLEDVEDEDDNSFMSIHMIHHLVSLMVQQVSREDLLPGEIALFIWKTAARLLRDIKMSEVRNRIVVVDLMTLFRLVLATSYNSASESNELQMLETLELLHNILDQLLFTINDRTVSFHVPWESQNEFMSYHLLIQLIRGLHGGNHFDQTDLDLKVFPADFLTSSAFYRATRLFSLLWRGEKEELEALLKVPSYLPFRLLFVNFVFPLGLIHSCQKSLHLSRVSRFLFGEEGTQISGRINMVKEFLSNRILYHSSDRSDILALPQEKKDFAWRGWKEIIEAEHALQSMLFFLQIERSESPRSIEWKRSTSPHSTKEEVSFFPSGAFLHHVLPPFADLERPFRSLLVVNKSSSRAQQSSINAHAADAPPIGIRRESNRSRTIFGRPSDPEAQFPRADLSLIASDHSNEEKSFEEKRLAYLKGLKQASPFPLSWDSALNSRTDPTFNFGPTSSYPSQPPINIFEGPNFESSATAPSQPPINIFRGFGFGSASPAQSTINAGFGGFDTRIPVPRSVPAAGSFGGFGSTVPPPSSSTTNSFGSGTSFGSTSPAQSTTNTSFGGFGSTAPPPSSSTTNALGSGSTSPTASVFSSLPSSVGESLSISPAEESVRQSPATQDPKSHSDVASKDTPSKDPTTDS